MRERDSKSRHDAHRRRHDGGPSRGHHSSRNPLAGLDLQETVPSATEGGSPGASPSRAAGKKRSRPLRRPIIVLSALAGLLLLALVGLSLLNRYLPEWPRQREAAAAALPSPAPAPKPPPPPRVLPRAGEPVGAVKLMMQAGLKGDTAAAYAQWEIGPRDLATVARGQQLTLAEQTERLAAAGGAGAADYRYRLLSRTGNEARVGQYQGELCTQTFSLRRHGSYWLIYNSASP